jgi:uncharacterized protein (DUF488 family)
MKDNSSNSIWTIGHSTRSIQEIEQILKSFSIEVLVDVRSYPGSNRYPHFNKENLEVYFPNKNIEYIHLKDLGGRRKTNPSSKNTLWRHPSFRAYADYMETDDFKEGIRVLERIALERRAAYMCSEAVWWKCHRSMISDYLKSIGWSVSHIMSTEKETAHRYTAPAQIINGELCYHPTYVQKEMYE